MKLALALQSLPTTLSRTKELKGTSCFLFHAHILKTRHIRFWPIKWEPEVRLHIEIPKVACFSELRSNYL